jgi:hypothetical protein
MAEITLILIFIALILIGVIMAGLFVGAFIGFMLASGLWK